MDGKAGGFLDFGKSDAGVERNDFELARFVVHFEDCQIGDEFHFARLQVGRLAFLECEKMASHAGEIDFLHEVAV